MMHEIADLWSTMAHSRGFDVTVPARDPSSGHVVAYLSKDGHRAKLAVSELEVMQNSSRMLDLLRGRFDEVVAELLKDAA